jgi:Skp family chaperone for outer membrane proteins
VLTLELPAALPTMETKMIEEIKELFQSFIAPAIEGVKGDIRALDAKLDAKIGAVDTKIGALDTKIGALDAKLDVKIDALDMKVESCRRELLAEVHRVEQGTYAIEKTLTTDFLRLEQKVDLSLAAMTEKMDLFRREMLAEIKAASK